MLKIALTGGIGSGKSTTSNCFVKFKVPVVDADKIVRELLQPGTAIYRKIVAYFGNSYLTSKRYINRQKLQQTIFQHPTKRRWLEKLLHTKIYAVMRQQLKILHAPYCILVIPLLYETHQTIPADRILLIDCPKKLQIKRCQKRIGYTTQHIQAILKNQVPRKIRLKNATDIIRNTGSLQQLKSAVKKMHHFYLSLI